jgi:hypothetical protein
MGVGTKKSIISVVYLIRNGQIIKFDYVFLEKPQ